MTTLTCPSTDLNFLSPNGFQLYIERLPGVSFFSQGVGIPGVSLGNLNTPTPLSGIAIPSNQLDYQPLEVSFMVDERMNNWFEIYKWMRGLGHPENFEQYTIENNRGYQNQADLPRNYSDATLTVMGSNNLLVRQFRFVDCFPTSLSSIQLASTNNDVQYATCNVTLEYSYFQVDT